MPSSRRSRGPGARPSSERRPSSGDPGAGWRPRAAVAMRVRSGRRSLRVKARDSVRQRRVRVEGAARRGLRKVLAWVVQAMRKSQVENRASAAELGQRPPSFAVGLLNQIRGLLGGAGHPVAAGVELRVGRLDQLFAARGRPSGDRIGAGSSSSGGRGEGRCSSRAGARPGSSSYPLRTREGAGTKPQPRGRLPDRGPSDHVERIRRCVPQ